VDPRAGRTATTCFVVSSTEYQSTPCPRCAKVAHVDKRALGDRIAQAREAAGMTQGGLGEAVGLDRTAITRLEKGERKLSAHELVAVAEALGRPMSYFVSAPVPAVVSRRSDTSHAHETTRALDVELQGFASDIQILMEMRLLTGHERAGDVKTPRDHTVAEQVAQEVRQKLSLGDAPVRDLGAVCERLGLHTFSASLGAAGPDGGCVEVGDATACLGAAVINGDTPAGRRRMTLTHELGHWLFGDAYDVQASSDSERMINSFAIHFLAPRAGIRTVWDQYGELPVRDQALAIGASFRLSWSAVIAQLKNVGFINDGEYRDLNEYEPRSGDYLRLGISWDEELKSPYVSPGFAAACLNGYVSGRLTGHRVIELLRGTLAAGDLPHQDPPSRDSLRTAFAGHGGG